MYASIRLCSSSATAVFSSSSQRAEIMLRWSRSLTEASRHHRCSFFIMVAKRLMDTKARPATCQWFRQSWMVEAFRRCFRTSKAVLKTRARVIKRSEKGLVSSMRALISSVFCTMQLLRSILDEAVFNFPKRAMRSSWSLRTKSMPWQNCCATLMATMSLAQCSAKMVCISKELSWPPDGDEGGDWLMPRNWKALSDKQVLRLTIA
mmetsp:Transcript_81321/g.252387  ORF Transcript_81321/g.252387 Transcript_81321/m.252387 type:complete len:206 (+) Transcript_81321:969-1586(+)